MIAYVTDIDGLTASDLAGFFEGWDRRPSGEDLLRVLEGSYRVVLARENGRVVGFITAVSDGLLNAHIPLLEVLPAFRRQGIGSTLMSLMLEQLEGLYAIDLACDDDLVGFYERFGLQPMTAMGLRRPESIYAPEG